MEKLTYQDIEAMYSNPEWLGFGYLGERRNVRQAIESGERVPEDETLVVFADDMVLAQANRYGLTIDQVFAWANSIKGRWYGDCWFGANGQHASRFLPTDFTY